ncbi:filaggrin-2-like [Ceratina calcarata]|uniref:Filaggrin-2-like n=1 Tax=Ceratina calcarata TaxID=156304 RepID=A0AAJ7WGD5_9HYME|nr:filaggrin-2-like [Ceratina calcarata]
MAKIISLSAVILGCILLSRAEPTVNAGYTIGGEDNGFTYSSNIINSAYLPGAGKESQRETSDFYSGGTGHSLTGVRSQGNLEESLRSSTYNGFSPSSHNTGFTGYSTAGRENLGTSSYFMNNAAQSGYDNYASSSSNVDSTLDTYTQGSDQPESDFSQFSITKHKTPSYMRFSDSLPGTSSIGSYPELNMEGSSLRGEYSPDSFRSHSSHSSGFMDADQTFNRDATSLFSTPSSDYSFGKHKEPAFAMTGTNKYTSEVYSPHPDSRYVRGNHGNVRDYASTMALLANSGSTPFRGSSGIYGTGKFSKYNKYASDYAPGTGLNYLSKDQDVDNYFFGKNTGSGKLTAIKDGRPGSYSSQSPYPVPGGPSYLGKLIGGYKSKPSFVSSYPGSSPVSYSSMPSSLHGSLSGSNYGENPLMRRYRSSSYGYGHPSMYPGYY